MGIDELMSLSEELERIKSSQQVEVHNKQKKKMVLQTVSLSQRTPCHCSKFTGVERMSSQVLEQDNYLRLFKTIKYIEIFFTQALSELKIVES